MCMNMPPVQLQHIRNGEIVLRSYLFILNNGFILYWSLYNKSYLFGVDIKTGHFLISLSKPSFHMTRTLLTSRQSAFWHTTYKTSTRTILSVTRQQHYKKSMPLVPINTNYNNLNCPAKHLWPSTNKYLPSLRVESLHPCCLTPQAVLKWKLSRLTAVHSAWP